MNVYDGERMAELLGAEGMRLRPTARTPTWSCSTPATSAKRRRRRPIPKSAAAQGGRRPDAVIALAGCVAQAEGAEIKRRAKAIDLVVGPQAYHRLPQMLLRRSNRRRASRSTPTCPRSTSSPPCPPPPGGVSAFLSVQEGCDKFCTYCVVPYTRGAEIIASRVGPRGRGRRWWMAARGRSRCSARTSMPGAARMARASRPRRADPPPGRLSMASSASATPPATRPTWATTLSPRMARCPS
jgi:hypothetical protein